MKRLLGLVVVGILMLTGQVAAVDIDIDGDVSDWGLSGLLSGDWSDPSTWVPTINGVSFYVEDNQDPYNTGAINYNSSYIGVHIYGNNTFQGIYREPLLAGNRAEPYGGTDGRFGEEYDIEAIYITENTTDIFVLIVFSTGMLNDKPYALGDLALDFWPGGGYGYEYGVNFHVVGNDAGDLFGIYATPDDDDWTIPSPFAENKPAEIADFSNKLGNAKVKYNVLNVYDFGKNNWIAEIAIPKSVVNNPDLPDDNPGRIARMFWISEGCGNDSGPSIPEFLSISIPIGLILGALYYFRRSK